MGFGVWGLGHLDYGVDFSVWGYMIQDLGRSDVVFQDLGFQDLEICLRAQGFIVPYIMGFSGFCRA